MAYALAREAATFEQLQQCVGCNDAKGLHPLIGENLRAAMEFAFDASGRRFEQTCMRAAAAANSPEIRILVRCTRAQPAYM